MATLVSSRERRLAWITGSIVGLLAFDRWILSPGLERWDLQTSALAEARDTLEKHDDVIGREQELRARWAEMASRLARVKAESVAPDFLNHLRGLAREAGVEFSDIHPSRVVDQVDFEEHQFETTTRCSVRSLSQLLYRVDCSPEFLAVPQFSAGGEDSGLNLSLRLSTLGPREREAAPEKTGPPPAERPNPQPYDRYRVVEDRSIFNPNRPKRRVGSAPVKKVMKEVEVRQQVVRLLLTGAVWLTNPDGYRAVILDKSKNETRLAATGEAIGKGMLTEIAFDHVVVTEGDVVRQVALGQPLWVEESVSTQLVPEDAEPPAGAKVTGTTVEVQASSAPALDPAAADDVRRRMMEKRKKEQGK